MSPFLLRATLGIVLPMAASLATAADEDPRSVSRMIDSEIGQSLERVRISPAPPATDAEFVRRAHLDVLGRIPTAEEAKQFLDDVAPEKRRRLIDGLMAHAEMPVWWSRVIHNWLNGSLPEPPYGGDEFIAFLEQALRENRPWDEVVRDMLLPDDADPVRRNAAWFIASRYKGGDKREQLDNVTTAVASGLFGVQLQCAKCHDHPFVDEWKQDHFYGLAAFLGRTEPFKVENVQVLSERADGEVTFVTTNHEEKTARPMFLDGRLIDEPPAAKGDDAYLVVKGKGGRPGVPKFSRRAALVAQALNAESPYLRQAIVNRVWKQLMGRGLVEPVDQIHAANPPSHPKLFETLSEDIASHKFDLKRLMAGILHSDAYQRSTRWDPPGNRPQESTYATAVLKPMSPDQWANSLSFATGHFTAFRAKLEREKAKLKLDEVTVAVARRRWERERDYGVIVERFRNESETYQVPVTQPLFLAYNDIVKRMLQPTADNPMARLVRLDDAAAAEAVWLGTLARRPTPDETAVFRQHVAGAPDRQAVLRDAMGAILSGEEFRFAP